MRFDYDKKNDELIVDGEGNLILTRNSSAIFLEKDFIYNGHFTTKFENITIMGTYDKKTGIPSSFRNKIKSSFHALRFIWKEGFR